MKAYILIWVLENFIGHRTMTAGLTRFESEKACRRAGERLTEMAANGQTQSAVVMWACEKVE